MKLYINKQKELKNEYVVTVNIRKNACTMGSLEIKGFQKDDEESIKRLENLINVLKSLENIPTYKYNKVGGYKYWFENNGTNQIYWLQNDYGGIGQYESYDIKYYDEKGHIYSVTVDK